MYSWILLISTLTMCNAVTQEMTMCNCTESTDIGILNVNQAPKCQLQPRMRLHANINYTIYTSITPHVQFKGLLCSVWVKRVTTDVYFFGGHNTVSTSFPREVSHNECRRLHKTLDCFGNQMQHNGDKWIFEADPTGRAIWMTTQQDDIVNCFIEDISLTQDCKDCPINSPIGTLGSNSSAEFATHNHISIVWDKRTVTHKKDCEIVALSEGKGQQFNSDTKGQIRVRDSEKQIDHFAFPPTTPPCNHRDALQLTVSDKFFIALNRPQRGALSDTFLSVWSDQSLPAHRFFCPFYTCCGPWFRNY